MDGHDNFHENLWGAMCGLYFGRSGISSGCTFRPLDSFLPSRSWRTHRTHLSWFTFWAFRSSATGWAIFTWRTLRGRLALCRGNYSIVLEQIRHTS